MKNSRKLRSKSRRTKPLSTTNDPGRLPRRRRLFVSKKASRQSHSLILLSGKGEYPFEKASPKRRKSRRGNELERMILPFVKLGTLALRTLAKPIASKLKQQAGVHPRFRELIVNLAQTNHRFSTTLQRRIYGHSTDVEIRPLNEEKAVQAAVDLIGELFIFSVAGGAIVFEVQRSSRSEAKKEELRRQELEALRRKGEDMAKEVDLLKQKLSEIEKNSKGWGLSGILHLKETNPPVGRHPAAISS
ncbi:hypothetical protein HPP92_024254 [Vanilla planifolia]|uniref:OPA3-like protein n=1 Tax=Vanilla planifolia TaxID=51239 RepID=A0A835PQD8_VANPL|nr:hypothetical protein HPP92_024254 [Vanilla planifolia]